jgi:hypothetical protein
MPLFAGVRPRSAETVIYLRRRHARSVDTAAESAM